MRLHTAAMTANAKISASVCTVLACVMVLAFTFVIAGQRTEDVCVPPQEGVGGRGPTWSSPVHLTCVYDNGEVETVIDVIPVLAGAIAGGAQ